MPWIILVMLLAAPLGATAGGLLSLETGPFQQARNDVRIPGDAGDEFALDELTGNGPWAYVRLTLAYDLSPEHGLRLVYAPLTISGQGTLEEPVAFAGQQFGAGAARARYQFNASRLTYRYTWLDGPRGRLRVGFTALLRDAEVRLEQGAVSARDSNVGLVPLLHLAGEYPLGGHWQLAFDADGLAAPQGRAFDLGVRLEYRAGGDWRYGFGYRTLEGGVDNDQVYNFAWFNFLALSVDRRF